MIWFQFLLNIIVHSAMAVLTVMTECTAMSQCDRGVYMIPILLLAAVICELHNSLIL